MTRAFVFSPAGLTLVAFVVSTAADNCSQSTANCEVVGLVQRSAKASLAADLERSRVTVTAAVLAEARSQVRQEAKALKKHLLDRWQGLSAPSLNASKLAGMFEATYRFTAEQALKLFSDGSVFVSTGDIKQMWLRDSSVQLMSYLPLAAKSAEGSAIRKMLESAMYRQVQFFLGDPYASAFFQTHGDGEDDGPNKAECPPSPSCPSCRCHGCVPACSTYTYQTQFELDSPLFVVLLHHAYWKTVGTAQHLSADFRKAVYTLVDLVRTEQFHDSKSPYNRKSARPGNFKEGIGLVWSQALPSDELAGPGYNVPQNIMLEVVLRKAAEMADGPLSDSSLATTLREEAASVDAGVQKYGVVPGPGREQIYAFSVDGLGGMQKMDDANMPNLLWLPFLGYEDPGKHYNATRRFVLSQRDSNFHHARYAGLGSEHESHGLRTNSGQECRGHCIWHLGLIMEGVTANSEHEKLNLMKEVLGTDNGASMLHEGFSENDASVYNRDAFGWANALFSQWVQQDWLSNH